MIETYGLTRRFGNFTAVSQVSLRVPDGAILALLGPNGAGKTTTVRMLSGLLAPTEGDATVAGYDIPTGCATRYKLVRFTLSGEELFGEAAKSLQVGPIHKTHQ